MVSDLITMRPNEEPKDFYKRVLIFMNKVILSKIEKAETWEDLHKQLKVMERVSERGLRFIENDIFGEDE